MTLLGIRCSTKDYAFAIIEGTKSHPIVRRAALIPFPKSYSRPQALHWFLQEIDELLRSADFAGVLLKGFEGRTRDKSFVERVEHEGVAQLAAAARNLEARRKISSTIAKDLGLKGRKHYLETLDTSPIPDFEGQPERVQEAILVAWSALA